MADNNAAQPTRYICQCGQLNPVDAEHCGKCRLSLPKSALPLSPETCEHDAVQPAAPFKVGDRVHNKHSSWPDATVTKITERGFKYEYDKPVLISPRLGSTTGGEAYCEGFESWEVVQPAAGVGELSAWQIVYNALESEGSKVIFDDAANRVDWCPNDSRCRGTPDHIPDCWLGQAMRLIPTHDTREPVRTPTPDVHERARRAAEQLYEQDLLFFDASYASGEEAKQRIAAIIAVEFGGGVKITS